MTATESSSHSPNPHLTDPFLQPFRVSNFSATDYLNSNLPIVEPIKQQKAAPSLSTVTSQTQSHVSALNAQSSRLSATLTGLTDDILRISSRLIYEVELLRGEALSLVDLLSSRGNLSEDILKFVPAGLDANDQPPVTSKSPSDPSKDIQKLRRRESTSQTLSHPSNQKNSTQIQEPEALPRLRTLLHVRAQLQIVIQRFNLALSFPIPPSLLTTATSSLISVNPPNQDSDLESKGQAALSRIKQEVMDLLIDAEGRGGGVERARQRVTDLRELCAVWKGTSEERARSKWVDGLEQMIDDEVKKKEESNKRRGGGANMDTKGDTSAVRMTADTSGPGFLRRLRDEIYVE